MKTNAAIIAAGHLAGYCVTALSNGSRVCYGRKLSDGCFHQHGTGKLSRAKKYFPEYWGTDENWYEVNQGGGPAV